MKRRAKKAMKKSKLRAEINEIEKIINDKDLMKKMGEKALSKSVKNVQENIYIEISKVIKGC